jgi:hypothetical protein
MVMNGLVELTAHKKSMTSTRGCWLPPHIKLYAIGFARLIMAIMGPLLSTDMRYHSRACSGIWLNWRPLMRALAVQVGLSVDDLRLLLTEVSGVLAAADTCSLGNLFRDLLHDPYAHPAIGMG